MKVAQRLGLKLLLAVMVITMILPRPAGAQVTALDEVRDLLRYDYVEPVREKILNSPTIDAILEQLDDPHTNFFTAAEFEAFNGSLEQSFSGIGIYLDIVKEGVKVTSLIDGSPADIANLHAGDIIISINGHSLPGLSSEETILLLRGPEGSQVQLLVLRDGASFSVAVERKKIEVPSVTDEILPFNIGYLKITTFGSETGQLFANCLENLRQQDPNAYIVDLRDNGGGYVNTALNIAGFFIGDQVAMQTRKKPAMFNAV